MRCVHFAPLSGQRPDASANSIGIRIELTASLKIISVGNSLGVLLPRELLHRLRVDKGDQLFLVETRDGYEIVPYSPELVAQIAALESSARADRDALKALTASHD